MTICDVILTIYAIIENRVNETLSEVVFLSKNVVVYQEKGGRGGGAREIYLENFQFKIPHSHCR